MSEYHLSFAEVEEMPLEILLDIEIVDSKIEAAFSAKRGGKNKRAKKEAYIDQIMGL